MNDTPAPPPPTTDHVNPAPLLVSLLQACAAWRLAEKRWAFIHVGEIEGDEKAAVEAEAQALTQVRIAFDRYQAATRLPLKALTSLVGECDWPEDASHENGGYQNQCHGCGLLFVGHKRRTICKVCARHGRIEA